ncbi:Bumetanide-sensitive sodium--chloride cotransporter [Daphnia magna]|nr:Bumetanide-sensitive sodium--chloride cotransporter [Daphnia magna]
MLLSKFRIDYSDLVIITDVDVPPKSKTKKWFDDLIRPLLQSANNEGPQLTAGELEAF